MASELKVDTISEKTSGGGVTIDGVLLKDGGITGDIQLSGTTPSLTIGDAGAEDAKLVFDGNAQDFYIALDDSADDLIIGLGSAVGTTPMLSFTEAKAAAFTGAVTMASTLGVTGVVTGAGFTAGSAVLAEAELELLDGLTAGTAIASKVVTTDASIDTSGQRNLTISGELDAATGDFSGAVDIAGATTVAALTASGVGQFDTMGIGAAKDLGGGLHIRTSDTGGSVEVHADELVLENDNNCGMTILAGNDDASIINFGDDGDNNIGMISYTHDGNFLRFKTNNVNEVHIGKGTAGAVATGGELAPDVGAGGICVDQNALDTFAMTLKSSDVAHGITDNAETDTYATFGKQDADNGGVFIQGVTENDSPIVMRGFYVTDNTYKTAQGNGAIRVEVGKKNGTGLAVAGADANVFSVRKSIGGNNTVFIVDEDGDIYYDGSAASYDTYDDALLVRAYDNYAAPDAVIQSKFDKFIKYNRQSLIDAKLIGDCPIEDELAGTNKPLVSLTGMSRLHNGAIWQQYEKHNQLLEAVYELAKESIGEEKAKAILKKHEVKRLN